MRLAGRRSEIGQAARIAAEANLRSYIYQHICDRDSTRRRRAIAEAFRNSSQDRRGGLPTGIAACVGQNGPRVTDSQIASIEMRRAARAKWAAAQSLE